jgi:hypothetical protein
MKKSVPIQRMARKVENLERILLDRREMLRSIKNDIGVSLHSALMEKISYEDSFLREASEAAAHAEIERERAELLLHPEYFTKKSLASIFF